MEKKFGNIFKGDKGIWMVFFILCIISIVEVFSASSFLTFKGGSYWSPVLKHVGILFMGMIFMIITINVKCKYFKIATPFLIIASIFLLIWVFFAGQATNDAHRWVTFFGLQFQPSEIAKGTMVLMTAQILSGTQTEKGAEPRAFWIIMGSCGFLIFLIAIENLSTAVLISSTIFMMMVIGRVPGKQIGGLLGVVTILVGLAVAFIMLVGDADEPKQAAGVELVDKAGGNKSDTITVTKAEAQQIEASEQEGGILHRASVWKRRIYDFFNKEQVAPQDVDLDKDAQVAHANIAIVKSNIVGRGPGNSEERDWLSQAFSDFIYAIIIEEMGIVGAFVVAFLYVILLFRAGKIAHRCENNFPAFLAMGIALMLVTQALFNMCVAVGLVPVTGQPLPLISKGGTSTVINCIYIGVILSISRTAKVRGQVTKKSSKTAEDSIPEE